MSEAPYISSEDSSLFRDALSRYSGGACLEIGAGNGGGLRVLAKRFGLAVGTDLLRPAMKDWSGEAEFVIADAASSFADSSFDFVAFNPPYLREEIRDGTVDGGEHLEVPFMFLKEALRVVKREGKVLMLLNQDVDVLALDELCRRGGFTVRKVAEKKLFFEVLSVYEASRISATA
ncbi:MAG TPA: methyltransferase domain-containing protein [Nitrososphaerales archaeon]|nr:methyltransferase domain-containing protein [Nitrososphaerales archaeon]